MTDILHTTDYRIALENDSHNPTLFNHHRFLHHQQSVQQRTIHIFTLYRLSDGRPLASLDVSQVPLTNRWITPVTGAFSHMATFAALSSEEIALFITTLSNYLFDAEHATSLEWKTPPLYFDSVANHRVHNTLFRLGWQQKTSELNFHLPVTDLATFRARLSGSKRKALNHLSRQQTTFWISDLPQKMSQVYQIINENRHAQGYPMTMEYPALLALKHALPDDVAFAGLELEGELVAGAILLRLNAQTLYVFYWGEAPAFRSQSPVIKLCEQLYLFAMEQQYSVLDIGISTHNSAPNEGLINFKLALGCDISGKALFYRERTLPFDEC